MSNKIKLNIKRYNDYETRFVPIRYIKELIFNNEFDLPTTQREKQWSDTQYEEFIESIFKNIPIGSLIFNKKDRKRYILDGQHRIHAITEFINNNIHINIDNKLIFFDKENKLIIDDDSMEFFLSCKIPIIEYENLSAKETESIILSINEGVYNDCTNIPIINNHNDNKNNKNNENNENLDLDFISDKLFKKAYVDIDRIKQQNLQKYISYIGWIIYNQLQLTNQIFSNEKYKLLNNTQARKFNQNLLTMSEKDKLELFELIKVYSGIIFNILDDYVKIKEMNNNLLNCLFYKFIELNKKNITINKDIIDKMISHAENRYSFYNLLLKLDEEIQKNEN